MLMLPFELSEYHQRILKTKQKMAEHGIDVLLLTDPANMNYLSGYDSWSFYVHQLLIVIIDEDQPFWIGRSMDAKGAEITTWLDPDHIIPYTDDYVQSSLKHPMDFATDFLKQIGQSNRIVGVEMDTYYFTAQCYVSLQRGLPNSRFKDATTLVNRVRGIKSEQEIRYMRKAAEIAGRSMRTALESIREGVRECDAAANIYQSQISGTESFGGDYPAIVPLLPSGENTSTPHLTWSDQRYKKGDPVIVELAGCYKRYHAPLARTLVIGEPSRQMKDLSKVVIEGLNAVLGSIRPGIKCEDLERVWRKTIAKSGFKKESRIGYAMGLNYPPDWGEHTASLRPGDLTVLQPNMTFHLIPGIWLDQCGVEISESFLVTETGCEVLTDFPRDLLLTETVEILYLKEEPS